MGHFFISSFSPALDEPLLFELRGSSRAYAGSSHAGGSHARCPHGLPERLQKAAIVFGLVDGNGCGDEGGSSVHLLHGDVVMLLLVMVMGGGSQRSGVKRGRRRRGQVRVMLLRRNGGGQLVDLLRLQLHRMDVCRVRLFVVAALASWMLLLSRNGHVLDLDMMLRLLVLLVLLLLRRYLLMKRDNGVWLMLLLLLLLLLLLMLLLLGNGRMRR